MKYYLPTLLEKLGLSTRTALMAGGIEVRFDPPNRPILFLLSHEESALLILGIFPAPVQTLTQNRDSPNPSIHSHSPNVATIVYPEDRYDRPRNAAHRPPRTANHARLGDPRDGICVAGMYIHTIHYMSSAIHRITRRANPIGLRKDQRRPRPSLPGQHEPRRRHRLRRLRLRLRIGV